MPRHRVQHALIAGALLRAAQTPARPPGNGVPPECGRRAELDEPYPVIPPSHVRELVRQERIALVVGETFRKRFREEDLEPSQAPSHHRRDPAPDRPDFGASREAHARREPRRARLQLARARRVDDPPPECAPPKGGERENTRGSGRPEQEESGHGPRPRGGESRPRTPGSGRHAATGTRRERGGRRRALAAGAREGVLAAARSGACRAGKIPVAGPGLGGCRERLAGRGRRGSLTRRGSRGRCTRNKRCWGRGTGRRRRPRGRRALRERGSRGRRDPRGHRIAMRRIDRRQDAHTKERRRQQLQQDDQPETVHEGRAQIASRGQRGHDREQGGDDGFGGDDGEHPLHGSHSSRRRSMRSTSLRSSVSWSLDSLTEPTRCVSRGVNDPSQSLSAVSRRR